MNKKSNYKVLFTFVFCSAIILRIIFGFVNTFSNDDHLEVSQIIKDENRIPIKTDCWECDEPKLYHVFVAIVLKIFHINNSKLQIIVAQLTNVLAGIITIYVVYLFLEQLHISKKLKLIGFSLTALNPKLIGINAQATNDSFVILFSTLALFFIWLYLKYEKQKDLLLMTLFTIMASLSKGNGLILFFLIIPILVVKLCLNWSRLKLRKKTLLHLFISLLLFLLITPYFGQYLGNYIRYGSPFVMPINKSPRPYLFKETFIEELVPGEQSGITSVFHSFLTFRFINLLNNPVTIGDIFFGDYRPYPRHRTSLWTQLYGRAHFIHFNLWPPIVRIDSKFIINLGRLIFILALFPTLIFLYSFTKRFLVLLKSIIKRQFNYFKNPDWIFVISIIAYVIFIMLFNYYYRDFTSMKVIFLYPVILAFLNIFLKGLTKTYRLFLKYEKILLSFDVLLILLVVGYVLNVIVLIFQLVSKV